MIIKTCNSCAGRPYTNDISLNNCPKCGNFLSMESVEEFELSGRPIIGASSNNSDIIPQNDIEFDSVIPQSETYINSYDGASYSANSVSNQQDNNEIVGYIYGYTNSETEGGKYRRLIFTKISDALFYGQRTEDVCHRFYVRPEKQYDNAHDIPVIVHGTISAGAGLQDNAMVKVRGKMHKGALYARKISIINNGFESPVKFQVGVLKLIITIFSLLLLIGGTALLLFDKNGVNSFLAQAKTFLSIFGIVFLVLFVLTTIILSRSKFMLTAGLLSGRGFRGYFIFDIILSVVLSIVIFNYFIIKGISIAAFAGAFGPIIILIIGIVLLLSVIFR